MFLSQDPLDVLWSKEVWHREGAGDHAELLHGWATAFDEPVQQPPATKQGQTWLVNVVRRHRVAGEGGFVYQFWLPATCLVVALRRLKRLVVAIMRIKAASPCSS